eukprot:gene10570-biopygen13854
MCAVCAVCRMCGVCRVSGFGWLACVAGPVGPAGPAGLVGPAGPAGPVGPVGLCERKAQPKRGVRREGVHPREVDYGAGWKRNGNCCFWTSLACLAVEAPLIDCGTPPRAVQYRV